MRTESGTWRHAEVLATSLLDDANVAGIVLNARDVTERKELEQQLAHQAFHDPLTNLANRSLFADRLDHALQQAAAPAAPLAVLYFDLDGFKSINDTLGHAAGDVLLEEVAARLASCVRSGDTISRWGGDEFGILLEELATDAEANAAAERLIDTFRDPFRSRRPRCSSAPASGSSCPRSARRRATTCCATPTSRCTAPRSSAPGSYCRYEPEMQADVRARVNSIATSVRRSTGTNSASRISRSSTSRHVASSASRHWPRWNHPTRGPIPPVEFIPAAEANGMIIEIGKFVLREACRNAALWRASRDDFTLSVNLSAPPAQ